MTKHSVKSALKPKPVAESMVESNEIVLPSHTNALGTIFGGVLMSWIDIAAAICATRHSRLVSVTASVDALSFIAPAKVGDVVTIRARMVYTGKTSMMVFVEAFAEKQITGEKHLCVTALLSFVGLNSLNKPTRVPPLVLKTREEKELFAWAAERRNLLLRLRNAPNPLTRGNKQQ